MSSSPLFTATTVGSVPLEHRVVLAPLTRLRASPEGVPSPLAAEYYSQRATKGGLLLTEATFISKEASGLAGAPGIWSQEQIDAWKKVTDAVHAKGGKIFIQLWAYGRVADAKLVKVVGPSDDVYEGTKVTALTEEDIERFIREYVQAAKNSIAAGFDGAEIHSANGYLLDQFLQDVSNHRTDQYGGSVENRIRFPLRVIQAVAGAIGADRTAFRVSPYSTFQGMKMAKPLDTFVPYVTEAVKLPLAYVHAVEGRISGASDSTDGQSDDESLAPLRDVVKAAGHNTRFLVAGGYTAQSVLKHAEQFPDDLVAFGRLFIANPDLVDRIAHGWSVNKYDRSTFYGGDSKGYTDYPFYNAVKATA